MLPGALTPYRVASEVENQESEKNKPVNFQNLSSFVLENSEFSQGQQNILKSSRNMTDAKKTNSDEKSSVPNLGLPKPKKPDWEIMSQMLPKQKSSSKDMQV